MTVRAPGPRLKELEAAIDRALGFLYGRQLAWGEFETLASPDKAMASRCTFQSSPFATAQVLYSLGGVRASRVQEILARGLDFLESEMEEGGVWRFWASRSEWHRLLPPDVDDTCCASFVLQMNRRRVPKNQSLILANRGNTGLFFTWLVPRGDVVPAASYAHHPLAGIEEALALSRFGEVDHVDCVVNANVLLYLGQSQETGLAVQHLIDVVVSGADGHCSDFYPDSVAFHYAVSRAYHNGVRGFRVLASLVTDRLSRLQRADGSFGNELLTALATCAMLNFGSKTSAIDRAAHFLLGAQAEDGSWPCQSMFLGAWRYYGSKELTTAVCVEALARCRDLTMGPRHSR